MAANHNKTRALQFRNSPAPVGKPDLADIPTPHGKSVAELCAVIEGLKAELRAARITVSSAAVAVPIGARP
jgi:hypothetical protein